MDTARRLAAAVLIIPVSALLTAGCGGDAAEIGQLRVAVTLSRSGGVGPSFERAPQPDQRVIAVDATGGSHAARTDHDGRARLSLTPGMYAVSAPSCPDAPTAVVVTADETTTVSLNCVAP